VRGDGVSDHGGGDIFYDGEPRPIGWLVGQLWHCSDIMPWLLCDELDLPRGSTYGMAVQDMSRSIDPA
jgi:hypothetical protein